MVAGTRSLGRYSVTRQQSKTVNRHIDSRVCRTLHYINLLKMRMGHC